LRNPWTTGAGIFDSAGSAPLDDLEVLDSLAAEFAELLEFAGMPGCPFEVAGGHVDAVVDHEMVDILRRKVLALGQRDGGLGLAGGRDQVTFLVPQFGIEGLAAALFLLIQRCKIEDVLFADRCWDIRALLAEGAFAPLSAN